MSIQRDEKYTQREKDRALEKVVSSFFSNMFTLLLFEKLINSSFSSFVFSILPFGFRLFFCQRRRRGYRRFHHSSFTSYISFIRIRHRCRLLLLLGRRRRHRIYCILFTFGCALPHTDGPTIVDINLMFRGISAISDNKMVSFPTLPLAIRFVHLPECSAPYSLCTVYLFVLDGREKTLFSQYIMFALIYIYIWLVQIE